MYSADSCDMLSSDFKDVTRLTDVATTCLSMIMIQKKSIFVFSVVLENVVGLMVYFASFQASNIVEHEI